jgi:16S rRNA (guanine1207-N2)-methyltransferase
MSSRVSLAFDGGGLSLPAQGKIAVFSPTQTDDLSALPLDRTQLILRMKPDVDYFTALGFNCITQADGPYAMSFVCIPRAKALALTLIAQAAEITDGPVVIDGQKTDGIDSILKSVRKLTGVQGPINKAHGKLFWVTDTGSDTFAGWQAGPALTDGGFWTAPGVFSADAIDPASAMLAEALPQKLGKTVADLGAGWGFLSAHILTRDDIEQAYLVEADHLSLECARRNVTDPKANYIWADATTWTAPTKLDSVVMNPPFHTGRDANIGLGKAFIQSAAANLSPSGSLWMVANRHLGYETTLAECFRSVVEVTGDTRFKVLHAHRPTRTKR